MSSSVRKVSTLVSTKWLADQLAQPSAPALRVLDGSFHLPFMKRNAFQEFRQGHITGAQFFDLDACSDKSSEYDHMLPPGEQFANYVGNLGIDNDTHIVVYDNNDTFGLFSAQRVWWTFRIFGHPLVSVLNGGLPAWKRDGYDLTDEIDKVDAKVFKAATRNDALIKSFEQMKANVAEGCQDFAVMDARPAGRFEGTSPEPRPGIKPGHMPSTINVPFTAVIDEKTKLMKSPSQLKAMFKTKGVDLEKPLTATCGSGVSACLLALAAFECGREDVAIYDGSWTEWFNRAPLELIKSS